MAINFTCATISSPRHTVINWQHNGASIDSGGRYVIGSDRSGIQAGSVVTVSTLTIDNVNGFDSGLVECMVTYSNADDTETVSISSETVLGVLGKPVQAAILL